MAGNPILNTIADFSAGLVGIFDNGLQIYKGLGTRLDALNIISQDTPETKPVAVVAPSPAAEASAASKTAFTINNISLLLIAAGALGAILLVIALRRK
ncbi:MAG: hypothetical protein PHP10_03625 [Candidatus Omnitrophica bacterium]|nr:hypothetical protein [Candidatus Omnitrophota bacterium]